MAEILKTVFLIITCQSTVSKRHLFSFRLVSWLVFLNVLRNRLIITFQVFNLEVQTPHPETKYQGLLRLLRQVVI